MQRRRGFGIASLGVAGWAAVALSQAVDVRASEERGDPQALDRHMTKDTNPTAGQTTYRGYYLMTPKPGGRPRFESIDCKLAARGLLDRVSVSPSEKRVCFEFQEGFDYKDTGRTLYIADFDGAQAMIANARAIANEEADPSPWYAYPRWTNDESAVMYHANTTGKGALYLYRLEDGSTKKVSTDDRADYRYPHGEATPK